MTTSTSSGFIQESFVEAGSIVESLVRHFRALLQHRDEPDDALASLMRYASREIGGTLLAAQSVDDLDDRLDEIVFGRKIYHINALAVRSVVPQAADAVGAALVLQQVFAPVLAVDSLAVLKSNAATLEHWIAAQLRLLATAGVADAVAQSGSEAGSWLLTDPSVPVEISEIMAATVGASACFLALVLAVDEHRAIRDENGAALVDRIVSGAKSHLRLLACFREAKVPAGVVQNPLDLREISAKHMRAERHVAKLLSALA